MIAIQQLHSASIAPEAIPGQTQWIIAYGDNQLAPSAQYVSWQLFDWLTDILVYGKQNYGVVDLIERSESHFFLVM